jgi:hypothetical protein
MFFTIDTDNEIVAHETAPAATDGVLVFSTEKELIKATAEWPMGRMVDTWNGFAGVAGAFGDLKPVKKFMDRPTAIKRIWKALQRLADEVRKAAAQKPPKPKAAKPANTKTPGDASAKPAPREGTHKAKIIELLKRDGGVTLDEIVAETGWQKHTIRAFVSTLPKKTGLQITSTRRESDKARVYGVAQ